MNSTITFTSNDLLTAISNVLEAMELSSDVIPQTGEFLEFINWVADISQEITISDISKLVTKHFEVTQEATFQTVRFQISVYRELLKQQRDSLRAC